MKKTINLTLAISSEEIDKYNHLMMINELDYKKNDIPRYSTINSWTVDAGNGYEIDLKVCSSDDGDPFWCEAVLFLNGSELACSDVEAKLDGVWELETNENCFVLNVGNRC